MVNPLEKPTLRITYPQKKKQVQSLALYRDVSPGMLKEWSEGRKNRLTAPLFSLPVNKGTKKPEPFAGSGIRT